MSVVIKLTFIEIEKDKKIVKLHYKNQEIYLDFCSVICFVTLM